MRIAILGTGLAGSALGRLWHAAGHDVTFAARHAAGPQALAAELGERAHAAAVADAVAGAEVVLVAVPGAVVTDVLQAAGPLDGRVVIDAANSFGRQQVTLRSLADAFPRARWVRAFNSISASIMASDHHREPPWVMFLSPPSPPVRPPVSRPTTSLSQRRAPHHVVVTTTWLPPRPSRTP